MDRELAFGRLLAIANVLGEKVFEKDKLSVSEKYMDRFRLKPMQTFEKIHADLMEYTHKFGESEMELLNFFGEIISSLNKSQFTNEPLNPNYLHAYYTQQNDLNNVIGVDEASKLWGLSAGTIKNYCAEGKVKAKKIGKTWIIDKNQENPSEKGSC